MLNALGVEHPNTQTMLNNFLTMLLAERGLDADQVDQETAMQMLVAAMREGDAGATTPPAAESADMEALMQAIIAFVNTPDWSAAQQALEAHQALLFQPAAESAFEEIIAHYQQQGDEETARMLERHLTILRACKAQGIAAVFAQLQAPPDATPEGEAESDQ
jgi:hypothetical protein